MNVPAHPWLFALALVACAPSLGGGDDDDDDATAAVDDDDATADNLLGLCPDGPPPSTQATDVASATIDGDLLTLEVGYSGGCEDHFFVLCFDGTFAESEPVQVWLGLSHTGTPDPCEAYITEPLEYDLTPLQDAWHDSYGAGAGEIWVHIEEQSVDYEF
ncbi:MAG: hypothetical protein GY898_29125 [Proteobacteria bacterium]|nr:hypothetical protein [Pseudomonadota bacterium]